MRPLSLSGLLGFVLVTASVAAAQVTTTTRYTYDPASLLPSVVTDSSSDGGYRRTVTAYAYTQLPEMRQRNMLSQVASTAVFGQAGPGGTPVACAETEWELDATANTFVPRRAHEGCGLDKVSTVHYERYDQLGRAIEVVEGGELRTEFFYGEPQNSYEGAAFPSDPSRDGHVRATADARLTGIRWSGGSLGHATGAAGLWVRYRYDALGRLVSTWDENKSETKYQYDGLGRLKSVRDGADRLLTSHAYGYAATEGTNYVETRTYASASSSVVGISVVDGLGRPTLALATDAAKDAYGRLLYEGSLTQYDAGGRPYRAWRPARVSEGKLSDVRGELKGKALSYYDGYEGNGAGENNRPYTETTYEPSPLGRVESVREPGSADHRTWYAYGVASPAVEFPRPEGAGPPMAYVQTTDADGHVSRTYTDGLGRTRFVAAGIGTAEKTLTETFYDAAGRMTAVRHPLYFSPRYREPPNDSRQVSTYTYNTRGHLTETTTPDAGRTRYKYDRRGRLRFELDASGAAQNQPVSPSVPRGSAGKVRFFSYDTLGRLTTEGEALIDCKWEDLDRHMVPQSSEERCRSLTEPATESFEGVGDAWVRLNIYDNPATAVSSKPDRVFGWPWYADRGFSFARPRGRLAAEAYKSDGQWQSVTYAYDERGRVAERLARTQGLAVEWEHVVYNYDWAGRLKKETVALRKGGIGTGAAYRFAEDYNYDQLGRLSTYWAGHSRERNPGRNDAPTPQTVKQQALTYEADGQVSYETYSGITGGNFKGRSRDYTVAGRLFDLGKRHKPDAAPYAERLAFTPGGLVYRQFHYSPHSGAAPFPYWHLDLYYDGLGRLRDSWQVSATGYGLYREAGITYDAAGNLRTLTRGMTDAGGQAVDVDRLAYSYAPGTSQLRNVTDAAPPTGVAWDADPGTFTYSGNGALASSTDLERDHVTKRSFSHDERGLALLLTESREGRDNKVITEARYRYDGAGQRLVKRVQTQIISVGGGVATERTVRDGSGRALAVLDGSGALKYWNLAGGLGRIAADGRRYYYVTDHLGTPRAVVRQDSVVTEARDYYSFGLQMPGRVYVSGTPTREGFTGHELDQETGMNYAGARYYMPALGRWTAVDPLAGEFASMSPYNYALNNPLSLVDPTGMAPCTYVNNDGETVNTNCYEENGRNVDAVVEADAEDDFDFGRLAWRSNSLDDDLRFDYGSSNDRPVSAGITGEQIENALSTLGSCAADELGITAVAGALGVGAGQNFLPTRAKFAGSIPGTSPASRAANAVFGNARSPVRLPTLVGGPGTRRPLRIAATRSVARFAGRAVPVVGWALLAYDGAMIASCTYQRLNGN